MVVGADGEPAAAAGWVPLPGLPIEGVHLPGTNSALFVVQPFYVFPPAENPASFVVIDAAGEPGPETEASPIDINVQLVALSPRADRAAFARRQVEILDRSGRTLASARFDDRIIDLRYAADALLVLTTGSREREDHLELFALDPEGQILGRSELPHRGSGGLVDTGNGALVLAEDYDDPYHVVAYSARCTP